VSYAREDKLYVPVHQADRLSRYVGSGDLTPAVSRLGTADWQLVKERARRAVAEIADDLLKLYAEREMVAGHTYSPDSPWQEEMEAAFPYQETDDQLRGRCRGQARHGVRQANGSPDLRRCRLR
jgi:transcription-repair coupling factor (superfamily II helicase)